MAGPRHDEERAAWRADEIAPEAHAAAEAVTAKVAELEQARRDWHQVAGRVASLIHDVAGIHPRAIPSLDQADSAVRELRRDIGDIPAPLPREPRTVRIPPEHDPDEGVREAARSNVREKAGSRKEA